jgi:hypothetical protein
MNERVKKIRKVGVSGKVILEINLKYNLSECGVDLPETDKGTLSYGCENGDEYSCFMKDDVFLYKLNDW